jgi:hypothetical protein
MEVFRKGLAEFISQLSVIVFAGTLAWSGWRAVDRVLERGLFTHFEAWRVAWYALVGIGACVVWRQYERGLRDGARADWLEKENKRLRDSRVRKE